jgi:WD40 repeat protein
MIGRNNQLVCSSKVDGSKMLTAAWKNEKEFMIGGTKIVKFFTMNGRKLDSKKGLFGKVGQTPVTSSTYCFKGQLITGTSKGKLLRWSGRKATKLIKLSKNSKAIWAVCSTENNLIVGDSEGHIFFLDDTYSEQRKIIVDTHFNPQIRALDYLEENDTLLVGTRGAEIYEFDSRGKGKCLMQGHFDGEVWGCAPHPK